MNKQFRKNKKLNALLMLLLFAATLLLGIACGHSGLETNGLETNQQVATEIIQTSIIETEQYTTPEEVAEYLYLYGHLPDNYLTKNEARELGWESNEGNLDEVASGMSIGGDSFGNREGLLPKAQGRKYYECDVNYSGGYRNSERLVYSNDGLIFYTADHYESFEQLYGEESGDN